MIARPLALPGGQFAVPGNRWDLLPDLVRPGLPNVSVVIPYYQQRPQLGLVLQALHLQDYPPSRFEIIVADDGSPEPLTLQPHASGPRVRVVRQEDRGFRAAAARNLGASMADGDVLCFLDQDTVPEPGYLRALTRLPAAAPDVLTVGRRNHADLTGWRPDQVAAWLRGAGAAPPELPAPGWLAGAYRQSGDLLHAEDDSYRFIISAVLCCSASLFREVGGFDERFSSYGGEDWEFAHRAWIAGAVFAHVPGAVAWHDGPDWAGRGDEATRRAEKARERSALVRLIPAPGRTPVSGAADLIVVWTGTATVEAGHLRTALRHLLESQLNLTVYLDKGEPERLDLDDVQALPVDDDTAARARYIITVDGDQPLDPSRLERGRASFTPDAGQVIVDVPGSPVPLTLISLRAQNRAARWQSSFPDQSLIQKLFTTVRVRAGTGDATSSRH